MKCQSYLPVYHSHYDPNVDMSGTRAMYNGNGNFRSGFCNNSVSTVPVPQANFGYKEVLCQTMLMQEVTFRDQVQELHQLYRRHRELMTDIKSKEIHMSSLHVEAQSSNSSSAKFSSSFGQDSDDIQRAFLCIKESKTPDIPVALRNGGILDNLPESKVKKIGGKLLDLELPAEVYIDGDEWESLREVKYAEGAASACLPSSKRCKFLDADGAASGVNSQLTNVRAGFPFSPSAQESSCKLADLNELPPISYLENSDRLQNEEKIPEIAERNDDSSINMAKSKVHISSDTKPSGSLVKNILVVQALPSVHNQSSFSKNAEVSRRSEGSLKQQLDYGSQSGASFGIPMSLQSSWSDSKLGSVACISLTSHHLKYVNGSTSIDLNSAFFGSAEFTPCADPSSGSVVIDVVSAKQNGRTSFNSLDGEATRKSKRCRVIDINLPCDTATDDEPFTEDVLAGHDYKDLGQINPNMRMKDDALPTKSSSLGRKASEINLEAPVSPEVEERPPPRGDSEENLPELTLQVSARECDDVGTLGEQAKIAAEAIVSMSCNTLLFSETKEWQNSEVSDSRDLELFAGFVCSFHTELDDDFGTLRCSEIDDFEAMTLKLTETNPEEYFCRNSVEISSQTCSVSMTGQTRKGRTRRPKIKKDFQRIVLPSLVSLSRYEVTEDLQIIEGLMEATGTPWQLRTRRACRMGRKPRVIKQQAPPTVVSELKCEFVMSWGKDIKRPRGNRSPVSPDTIMSRWLGFAA